MIKPRGSGRPSIRHLRAFVEVATHGSLTRAAESLCVTQSALSLTIQNIENDLGVQLFDRSTRLVELTSAGREFLPVAQRLVLDFDSSIRDMRALGQRERGKVGVAAVPSVMSLLLSQAVASYIETFPGIDVYLREENSEMVQQRILNGDVDFGICSPWEPAAELSFEPLFEDSFGVVFSPQHPLSASSEELGWEEIAPYRVVGFSADLGMQHQLSHIDYLSQEIREPRYRVSNTATIEKLLQSSDRVSIMSALAARREPLDRLSLRLLKAPVVKRTVGVVRRLGRSLTPAAQALLDEIRLHVDQLVQYRGVRIMPCPENASVPPADAMVKKAEVDATSPAGKVSRPLVADIAP